MIRTKKFMKAGILLFMMMGIGIQLHAGNGGGSLKGRVIDYKTGQALVGANVMISGTSMGAATDLDGHYVIYDVPPGTYDVSVSYVGYENQAVKGLQIQKDENHYLDVALIPSVMNLSEIVVEARASSNSDAYLISEKRQSSNVQDGVSGSQMSRSGDSNAADAVKRITGVSVLNGNTVYVRGLGDRYVSTQMNGVPIPSPEPEKKNVPLNLFSTGILESITAYKTFTPDLPGSFGGGTVDILTKAYPDQRIFNASLGFSGSTDLVGAQFRLGSQGSLDFFGFDDGIRSLPAEIPENKILSKYNGNDILSHYQSLADYGRAFSTDMTSSEENSFMPVSIGFNAGNRYTPTKNLEYGYYTNVHFSNDYGYREEIFRKYSASDEKMIARTDLLNQKSSYKTNLSISGSMGAKINNQHKLKLSSLYTHASENAFTYGSGKTPNLDEKGIYLREYFVEKSILNTSLTGLHHFDKLADSRVEWIINTGLSQLSEPDGKSQNYKYYPGEEIYRLASSSAKAGIRDFTKGFDFNGNADVNYSLNLKDRLGELYKIKTGGRLQYKLRSFQKRSFYHEYSNGTWPDELISLDIKSHPDSFGEIFREENYFSYNSNDQHIREGLILLESTDGATRNAYDAREINNALYVMTDIPLGMGRYTTLNKWRIIGGVRIEDYRVTIASYNPVTGVPYTSDILGGEQVETNLHETTLLPSLNLVYNPSDYQKFRFSYSNTVARAEFREMAPYEFQAFYGGNPVVGYPYLQSSRIGNYDFRYEWYRMAGEIFSVGAFFKDFSHPIEKVIIETADESYITFQNAEHATTYGIEVDYRTHLPIIPLESGKIMVTFNTTLSRSRVKSPETIRLFTGAETPNNAQSLVRPLQGQSDIMLNLSLNYHGLKGFSGSLSYHTFSPRLNALGSGDVPNEYEFPFHSLNLTFNKSMGSLNLSFKIKNILNSMVRFGFEKDDRLYITDQYRPGMGAGISLSYAM